MLDIWKQTQGTKHIKPLIATLYRLVESQEQVATLGLVNNVYEQGILEALIEGTKAPMPDATHTLHYLLKTPFRYPPLPYGSRFGNRFERGLFYGSLTINTALAETAYYRFVYMRGPEIPFSSTISNEYTSFSISIKSDYGIFLDRFPFAEYEPLLTSPVSYTATQQLGLAMRNEQVEVFRYISARDKLKGKNLALFTPNAFCGLKPSNVSTWLCQTNIEEVGFLSTTEDKRLLYYQHDFCVEGTFPSPAI